MIKAFQKAKKGLEYSGPWKRKPTNMYINTPLSETLEILESLQSKEILSVDIETGAGIINTMGFAWSPNDAIAINTLPDTLKEEEYFLLWNKIAEILENNKIKKILQNNIYEAMYFSKYGIGMTNIHHDTMWAQRVLYPEFKVGLGNVGRMYTDEIYWKDDGKTEGSTEKKDWNNIKDWDKHFLYNCKDTLGTFEGYLSQRMDLESRAMDKFFYSYIMRLADPIIEMCTRGLPVSEAKRLELETNTQKKIDSLTTDLSAKFNHRSPKQKKEFFQSKGYKMPKKRDPKTKKYKDSTDELAMKKLRLKYPEDTDIQVLLKLAKLEKALSSYIKFDYDSDSQVRFMMNGCGTETLRFSSSLDPWGNGFNAQTLPYKYKSLFPAPAGHHWINVDLKQAESRYVAYACADPDLIEMLENPNKDIHSFVAAAIFETTEEQIVLEKNNGDAAKRQLGKKSGHGANYDMAGTTFMESCLKEMDLVITRKEADRILATYHRLFPGIRRGHEKVRQQLWNNGYLENPFGFRRYFYGRRDDNTFREAYAFEPQSTIPAITNHLLLHLLGQRTENKLDFNLHLQVHDSILMLCKIEDSRYIMDECLKTQNWHPELILPAGKLIIPTETSFGTELHNLEEYTP
jgi:DNA polymerase I-like protein with 3'-5' exonuclease and polymerase domains